MCIKRDWYAASLYALKNGSDVPEFPQWADRPVMIQSASVKAFLDPSENLLIAFSNHPAAIIKNV